MPMHEPVSCPGVLALEVTAGARPARVAVERDEAEQLAAFVADDLRALLPGVERSKLALVGAHFDSTELLRPGFPVFATLTTLAHGAEGEVVAFGTRDGHMPATPLVPEPGLRGGALRVVPWTVLAEAELARDFIASMERDLGGKGEVGTRTADWIMRTFGTHLEHARYFTPHDLMAMVEVHYEHMNLAPLWTLIEAALLTPERAEHTVSAHGLAWRQADARAYAQSPGAWLAATSMPADERPLALAGIVFELRQYSALLAAHHIAFGCDRAYFAETGHFIVDTIAAANAGLPPPRLYAHEAPGLGVVALTVAQAASGHAHVLANAWPLAPDLAPACRHLAETFGCAVHPHRLGTVVLDVAGRLGVPTGTSPRNNCANRTA